MMKKPVSVNLLILLFSLLGAEGALSAGGLISPADAKSLIATDKSAVILDVRTADEFAAGHIAGSLLLSYDEITAVSAAKAIPAKSATIVVYCRSGRRSAIAATSLRKLGYTTVWDLGGIGNWPYGTVK